MKLPELNSCIFTCVVRNSKVILQSNFLTGRSYIVVIKDKVLEFGMPLPKRVNGLQAYCPQGNVLSPTPSKYVSNALHTFCHTCSKNPRAIHLCLRGRSFHFCKIFILSGLGVKIHIKCTDE